jgi:hypothetical protein
MIGSTGMTDIGSVGAGSAVSAASRIAGGRGSGSEFLGALRRAEESAGGEGSSRGERVSWDERVKQQREAREDPERFERAQRGAEQLVAATFIVPILQQLRESSTAEAPFGPGMYEKRLGPMLDAQIADRIVSAQRLPIVEAVRDRMLGVMQSRLKTEAEGANDAAEPER